MLPKPNPAVLFQELPDGAILLNPEQEIYFGLNVVGVQIWQLLPPVCSELAELCVAVGRCYPDVEARVVEGDVQELLDALSAEGLVVQQS
jgi:hypothetical protein